MPRPNIRNQIGATVKQFGRFQLKRFEVYRDDRQIQTNLYLVTLDNGDGGDQNLDFIEAEKSTLPELLNYLHTYQHHENIRNYRVKLSSEQEADDEVRTRVQQYVAFLEQNYARVDHAIRELEPDYQPDETIPDIPYDPSNENKETYFH